MTTKQNYAYIRKYNDYCGRLGFAISESINDMDNCYEYIGECLDYLIDKYPDKIGLIEEVVIALSGYSFETLRKIIREQKEYYNSL